MIFKSKKKWSRNAYRKTTECTFHQCYSCLVQNDTSARVPFVPHVHIKLPTLSPWPFRNGIQKKKKNHFHNTIIIIIVCPMVWNNYYTGFRFSVRIPICGVYLQLLLRYNEFLTRSFCNLFEILENIYDSTRGVRDTDENIHRYTIVVFNK